VGDVRFWPPKNKMKKILGDKTKQYRRFHRDSNPG
jgi:hypothetical protein